MAGPLPRRAGGFTLIELLVALFITAIMFAIGYRSLDQAFRSRAQLQEQSARLLEVQRAVRTLEQDFELLQPRPVRQLTGDGYLPAIMASGTAGVALGGDASGSADTSAGSTLGSVSSLGGATLPLVSLTRGGWSNPAGLPRSELQRVSYSIENGALMRSYTPELDSTLAVQPIRRKLLDHVRSFTLRFMDAGHQWQTQWPVPALANGQQALALRIRPVAVEVTIELQDWGLLVRHIEVGG